MEGQIPPELGKLSNLRKLSFSENYNFIGQIPEAIFNISSLEMIDFSNNNLSGRIPTTTGLHLPNLKVLELGVNQLEGEIPLFITNSSKLQILSLIDNFLTGTIPTNLGNLRELQELFLHTNQLTNEPREYELRFFNSLADCRMLKYLQVGSNLLYGILPNSIGSLSSTIQKFEIGDAHINGIIPTSIGNMTGLTSLSLGGNNLTGNIPSEIGKLKQLQGLYLDNNKLQGHIPEAVCHLSNLVHSYLDNNELSGLIPECLGNLSMLQKLFLSSNKLSKIPGNLWKMSGLLYLSVSQNSIEGKIPLDIGELKAIVEIHLSGNHFSGMIPSTFGALQNLQSLDLSNNSFFGQIPLSLANLISLEFLNLSLNALSGSIPMSLEKLSYLKSINVSFNDLEGVIPSGGVFAHSTVQSFLGNKGLCGMHILEIPACAITNPGKQSKLKEVLLKIVTPVVISSLLIFLLVSIWIMKRQKKEKCKDVEKVLEIRTHQLVSYYDIQQATNNFDEFNLIGVGSSSTVFKGTLSSGTAVAIKVLDLENEQVCKRFDTECEVMRNVRHRNLVPVITTCSSDYIRAFVLKFMPNGSLENWLYKEDRHLNLHQRVTVMLDTAMAVEYLHHGHVTPIVHCDLKPANVLLDEDMVAHVGDFGISKILAISKSMAYTETLGTLGYIAPEYGSDGIVSASGDVYSYGIMLMEVLTKRRPTDEEICNENLDLRKWITQSFSGSMMDVVDANLFSEEEQITSESEICIASMIELGLDCTKEMPESRITMKDVVTRLNKINNTFLET
ncbi:LRR receptor-like serine/threonine-protein kinase EFR [Solanum tuberosum]|nr:PREDICTED: LRR receptor-like serine/threonine-protein kinase EFR [Solanum tuberosum]